MTMAYDPLADSQRRASEIALASRPGDATGRGPDDVVGGAVEYADPVIRVRDPQTGHLAYLGRLSAAPPEIRRLAGYGPGDAA